MNSTSFTSITETSDGGGGLGANGAISGSSNGASAADKLANLDTSSTAHLTLNSTPTTTNGSHKINNGSATGAGSGRFLHNNSSSMLRSARSSDSDPDRSPSVTVLTSGNNHLHHHHHHHHHHHLDSLTSRVSQLMNRIHLTKCNQRNMWSRASKLEKILLCSVIVLGTLCILLFCSLISIFMTQQKQQQQLEFHDNHEHDQNINNRNNQQHSTSGAGLFNNTTSCGSSFGAGAVTEAQTKKFCMTPDCVTVAASVIEAIDLTVDPCDDFYMYSCGDWIKSNPLPDGKSNWGTFSKLWQDNQSIMRAVLEGATFEKGSAEEKAKIYYESCLDRNDTVESRGIKPMQDLIESAGGWGISGEFNAKEWDLQSALQIYHNQYNRGGLFSWAVGADERNSTRNIIQLDQGGLGLPSRDYYLNKTDKNVLDAYFLYMVKVAELMGGTNVEEQMRDLLKFEKKLAAITVPQDQRRDDERMYHKFTLKELTKTSPFLNWTKYFDDAFDYHSRTTISFSSEIKPRNHQASESIVSGLKEVVSSKNNNSSDASLKNQTQYSIMGSTISPSSITNNNNNNNNNNNGSNTITALSDDDNNNKKQRHPSTISKHKIEEDENVVIYSPEYFDELSSLISDYISTERGKTTLANYMAWSVIQSLIATLPKNFRDASKVLRKALIGSEGIEVSWRYCVTDTNQVMGFALGSLFVRRVFQGDSKERAEEMIYSIRNAFKDNLPNLAWMDDKTRQLAKEKADHINQMIGFPDFILSPGELNSKYEGLELDENNYFENNIKVNVLSLRENMEKINKPANKTEWEMTPPMVNAYYTPTKNQIVFPAGILQTPFYDLSYPNSLNFGAMGVVMGHELTHAFDDQGREYDKDGNLYQWWFNETLKNFEDRVKCFVDQYSSYKVDDTNLNGKQTLGENIADNGGLKAAFRAYEKWADINPEPQLPGLNLTGKQLFFVGFAQVWCSISTPEALKLQVLNDPHAPAQYRVIGTLSNSQEFAREFNCAPGTNMNPEKKCVVW